MRWKLLLRRFSVAAPRVIVRSRLPWPVRWAVVAVAFGFSAALALGAFEFGREFAGLDTHSKEELDRLRSEVARLRTDGERAQRVADTAESLLKAERAAQEQLAQQVRRLEEERQALLADLGFFENLLPVSGEGVQVRGLQVQSRSAGELRFQMLVMSSGKVAREFVGGFEFILSGTMAGRPWTQPMPGGPRPLNVRPYQRLEGEIPYPPSAVIKSVQLRIVDQQGAVKAVQSVKL